MEKKNEKNQANNNTMKYGIEELKNNQDKLREEKAALIHHSSTSHMRLEGAMEILPQALASKP